MPQNETQSIALQRPRLSLSITGASGGIYGIACLRELYRLGCEIDLIFSRSALEALYLENDFPKIPEEILKTIGLMEGLQDGRIRIHHIDNIASALASGSAIRNLHAGLIVPCSMGTCARIAHGISSNLIERHADVLMKERKPLVFVPRETPLSEIHLENMLRLVRLGCTCVPASPGFYHRPQSVQEMIQHVIGKVFDVINLPHDLYKRWEGVK